jgi:hypothetical protein
MVNKGRIENIKPKRMKSLLLSLLQITGTDALLLQINRSMKEACGCCLSPEARKQANIAELENDFYTAFKNQDFEQTKQALKNLSKAYADYGLPPTQKTKGKFEALHFLLELEEVVDVLALQPA